MRTLISTITDKTIADKRFSKEMPFCEYIELWISTGEKLYKEFLDDGLVQTADKVRAHLDSAMGDRLRAAQRERA